MYHRGDNMLVKEIMTKGVITVRPDAPMKSLGKLFKEKRISGVPVVDERDDLVGVVTITDMLKMLHEIYKWSKLEEGNEGLGMSSDLQRKKDSAKVGDCMTQVVHSVQEDMDIAEAMNLMFDKNIHTIPVLKDAKLTGVIGVRDIIALCYKEG